MIEPENRENWCLVILKFLGFYWKGIFILVWPFISALVFIISFEKKIRCLFVLVLMAGYWITEVAPLGVTGLMPMFMLPILDVQDTGSICVNYINKTTVIFMASIMIAIGIEHCGLHKRIAFTTLMWMGCSPRRLHFGLTMVTALLSMWLVNAACTAMMCPVIKAVILELEAQGTGSFFKPKDPKDSEDAPPKPSNITIAYMLTAAYASTIGGIGSLVGTGTNLTYKGIYETRFPDGNRIEFVPWLLFNFPQMLVLCFLCWITTEWMFMGLWRPKSEESIIVEEGNANSLATYEVIKERQLELGKMSWVESAVLTLFLLCILAWFFRKPQFIKGWGDFYEVRVADSTPAVIAVFFFAALPSSFAFFSYCTMDKSARPQRASAPLVPWKVLNDKMPWDLLFLLGGGSALADAGKKSGMAQFLGEQLAEMSKLPHIVVLCLTNFIASMATEITSNVAMCNILTPVLIEMSISMDAHPMSFTYTCAIMCSFAFLTPVGTPPNAIVAQAANIRTIDMLKGGVLIKFFSWAIYMVLYPTYGHVLFDHGESPEWAKQNVTPGT